MAFAAPEAAAGAAEAAAGAAEAAAGAAEAAAGAAEAAAGAAAAAAPEAAAGAAAAVPLAAPGTAALKSNPPPRAPIAFRASWAACSPTVNYRCETVRLPHVQKKATYVNGIVERPVLGDGTNDGLMVSGRVDREDTVGASRETL